MSLTSINYTNWWEQTKDALQYIAEIVRIVLHVLLEYNGLFGLL